MTSTTLNRTYLQDTSSLQYWYIATASTAALCDRLLLPEDEFDGTIITDTPAESFVFYSVHT